MESPFITRRRALWEKTAERYMSLARYWMGPRVVTSWQTVEFISEQAAHCTREAVRASRIAQSF